MAGQFFERSSGQCADRIEGDVAEQLHPDFVTEPRRHRTAEAGRNQRVGDGFGPLGLAAVRLAKADAIALGVMNDARLGDVGREVGQRADDAAGLDRRGDDAAGIDAFEPEAVELTAVTLEVPPRDPVLRGDDHRIRTEERTQRRRQGGEAVRLDAKKDDVGGADRGEIAGDLRLDLEVAVSAGDAKATRLHRLQVRPAREQHHVGARTREACPDVAADCPGPRDDDPHVVCGANACATTRR